MSPTRDAWKPLRAKTRTAASRQLAAGVGRPLGHASRSIIGRLCRRSPATTVADLTRYLPGPFASRELLRLGARVVKIEPPEGDPSRRRTRLVPRAERGQGDRLRGTRAASRRRRRRSPRRTSCSRDSARASGSGSASSCRRRRDPLLDHRLRRRRARARRRPATTSTTSATPACSPTPRLRCRPSRSPTSPPAPRRAVIEILAALLARAQSGRGRRLSISMTHGSHQFVAHRLAGDPVAAPAHRRRRLLPDLRDRRRPPPDGRGARAEVLAAPLRADRAAGSRRARVRARAARARGALPDAHDARVARPARARGHVRRAGPLSRRVGGRARVKLVAIAFALLGIHVGPHRTIPVGYAPAWSPNAERIAYVTRGDLWVADADGSHRARLVARGRPARLGAERAAARVRARRLGLDDPRGRARRAEARARRTSRLVARRHAHRLRP